MIVMLERGLIA